MDDYALEAIDLWERIQVLPPIVKRAVLALIEFEERQVDPIGYDLSYYQEDLPRIVANAIQPWKAYGP